MLSGRSVVASAVSFLVLAVLGVMSARALAAGPGGGDTDPAKPGALAVMAFDAGGKAVAGARVEVRSHDRTVARGLTNREGKFVARPLRPGFYAVLAGKPGVGTGHQRAEVKPDQLTGIKIELKK